MQHNDDQAQRIYENGIRAAAATMILRDPIVLYSTWRHYADLPRFIDSLVRVEVIDTLRSRWVVKGPADTRLSWTAEIIRDEPGNVIAWKTVGEGDVQSAGSIRFRERLHNRGTEVKVVLEYVPPGGILGDVAAKRLGDDAKTMLRLGLHRFRQLMETGEIPVAKGQPVGANSKRADRPGESDQRTTDANLRDIASGESAT